MADGATAQASCGNSRTIPISSALHQGGRRLITLVDEEIVLDPNVTLNGAAATTLCDVLRTWLGEYAGEVSDEHQHD